MQKNIKPIIFFTGGGTGGHVFPALSLIPLLIEDFQIIWIGSLNGIERQIIKNEGILYKGIPSGNFRRYFSLKNFTDVFKILAGFFVSICLVIRYRPVLLFSKGGFVSVPPAAASALFRIPVITHESDLDPGLATKINSLYARYICVPFKESLDYFKPVLRSKILITGNPVREIFFKKDFIDIRVKYQLSPDNPYIFIVGGSSGSSIINNVIYQLAPLICDEFSIIHQTGNNEIPENLESIKNYKCIQFITDDYPHILNGCSLVISRGGAGSLWEIAAMKKPAIIIPLSTMISRGDQERNTDIFVQAGCCISIQEASLTCEKLLQNVHKILHNIEIIDTMKRKYDLFKVDGANSLISQLIKREAGK